ncbi:nucleocapsid [Blechmonas luni leishbunyavirus 1]|uniref:Nucleocapsid n=1 Tax=Blechmonas luni leishbunyavirus 1 TaxID=2364198 RepID=A0A386ISA3_9VIRU|nr:nucleocapsid [Blechmonas luni leishbunyavirus 1]
MPEPPFDISYVELLSYQGTRPYDTRVRIESLGLQNRAKLVAMMVGCRGTNLSKISARAADPEFAKTLSKLASDLSEELQVSIAHIASAYPEVVYDSRIKSNSQVSVNTLQFLKHNGLSYTQWMLANEKFCELVGLDFDKFSRISKQIWEDDSFSGIVGNRLPT